MAVERIEGQTPAGGSYAIAYFSRDGKPADKADAKEVEILEYTAEGECINRTYGRADAEQSLTANP